MLLKNVVAGLVMASAAIGIAGCGSESALNPTELMAKVGCTEPVAEDLVPGAGTTAQYRCSGRDGGSAGNGLVQSMMFFFSSEGRDRPLSPMRSRALVPASSLQRGGS